METFKAKLRESGICKKTERTERSFRDDETTSRPSLEDRRGRHGPGPPRDVDQDVDQDVDAETVSERPGASESFRPSTPLDAGVMGDSGIPPLGVAGGPWLNPDALTCPYVLAPTALQGDVVEDVGRGTQQTKPRRLLTSARLRLHRSS